MKTLAERLLVPGGFWPNFRRGFVLGCVIGLVLFILIALARADSTFVPIEPEKPTICQKVCPVCGNCVAKPFGYGTTNFDFREIPYTIYACSSYHGDTTRSFNVLDSEHCDSIIWGRWRTICRVDTVGARLVGGPPDEPYALWFRLDTIYTNDPRCKKEKKQ